jgi:hypothetical protein
VVRPLSFIILVSAVWCRRRGVGLKKTCPFF